jgi:predicted solute-binding protein
MTDFRALSSRLLAALKTWSPAGGGPLEGAEEQYEAALIAEADAALAQPEPQGPTMADLMQLWRACNSPSVFARAVLARWGRPAIEPQGPSDQELLRIYGVATPCYHVEEYKKELDFARAVWNLARR